jgi:hypothetical protein
MSPAEALTQAQIVANRTDEEKTIIKETYAATVKEDPNDAALMTVMSEEKDAQGRPWYHYVSPTVFILEPVYSALFGEEVAPTIQQKAEFDRLTQNYFGYTGDIEQARTMAANTMKRSWKQTGVNGFNQNMKGAPEVVHGMSTEDVREQLTEYATHHGKKIEDIRITSDLQSLNTGTYPVWAHVPDTDAWEMLRDEDGYQRRFKPNQQLASKKKNAAGWTKFEKERANVEALQKFTELPEYKAIIEGMELFE